MPNEFQENSSQEVNTKSEKSGRIYEDIELKNKEDGEAVKAVIRNAGTEDREGITRVIQDTWDWRGCIL